MIIREATILDHTAIVYSILEQIGESSSNIPQANRHIGVWVTNVLISGYTIVAEEEGRIIGTIGMSRGYFPWNDEVPILTNDWFHVSKEYRSGDVAAQLIAAIKDFSDKNNIIVRFEIINDHKVEKIDRFLKIKGMHYMGGNFIYGMGVR